MSRTERPSEHMEALVASFEPYSKAELAEMLAHLTHTYVVEGTSPKKPELGIIDFPKHLRQLNFVQLVQQLKIHLDLPELNLFSITGSDVLVNLGGRDFSLTDPHAMPGPPAGGPAPAQEPGAPPQAPGAPVPPAAPSQGPGAQEQAPTKPEGPVEISDRFRMLELD